MRLPTTHGTGLKLYSAYQYTIRPWECGIVRTDLMMKLEEDVHAQIRAIHPDQQAFRDLDVFPIALPPSFRGALSMSVHNLTHGGVIIPQYSAVALLVFQTTRRPVVMEVPYCLL